MIEDILKNKIIDQSLTTSSLSSSSPSSIILVIVYFLAACLQFSLAYILFFFSGPCLGELEKLAMKAIPGGQSCQQVVKWGMAGGNNPGAGG